LDTHMDAVLGSDIVCKTSSAHTDAVLSYDIIGKTLCDTTIDTFIYRKFYPQFSALDVACFTFLIWLLDDIGFHANMHICMKSSNKSSINIYCAFLWKATRLIVQ